ncbi:nucleolar complex-associated protein-domain-containing protein [Lipomyces oligophaga]|uniref:nucleolar complex-associated protein-domain-containing protein n=1 Tax=Lipomyces oligophaga TaxID=45792 RepID=UPI0034CEA39F
MLSIVTEKRLKSERAGPLKRRKLQQHSGPRLKAGSIKNSEFKNYLYEEDELRELPSNSDNEVQSYEQSGARYWSGTDHHSEVVERLPIKTTTGALQRVLIQTKDKSAEEKVNEIDSDVNEEGSTDLEDLEELDEPKLPEIVQFRLAQEELSRLAGELIEDPEEKIENLAKLQSYAKCGNFRLKRFALASQLAVFKSIIPGYRIRPLSDLEKSEKVSKEVKKLRHFEQTLVLQYRAFIDCLEKFVRPLFGLDPSSASIKLSLTALSCTCHLLSSVPHFNFRTELLQIVGQRLGRRRLLLHDSVTLIDSTSDCGFDECIQCLNNLFYEDEEGASSLDGVKMITSLLKKRKYKVDEAVLNTFLHLRLLTDLSSLDAARLNQTAQDAQQKPKIKKKERLHRTKSEKKRAKELKQIEEELAKAEYATSKEEIERWQAETLKLTFATYLEILKARSHRLMGASLEGLAKFAHLINADLFGDLLEVLKELIRNRQFDDKSLKYLEAETQISRNMVREGLLCVMTAFTLLSGQAGESIGLDLSFFVNYLYSILIEISLSSDLERSNTTLRLSDPLKREENFSDRKYESRVSLSTETEMILKCFDTIFFDKRYKTVNFGSSSGGHQRLIAFTKRVSVASVHFPEKSAFAVNKLLDHMCRSFTGHSAVDQIQTSTGSGPLAPLFSTNDKVMNGIYKPLAEVPEQSNPAAALLWENFLMDKHYSPRVADLARKIPLRTIGR